MQACMTCSPTAWIWFATAGLGSRAPRRMSAQHVAAHAALTMGVTPLRAASGRAHGRTRARPAHTPELSPQTYGPARTDSPPTNRGTIVARVSGRSPARAWWRRQPWPPIVTRSHAAWARASARALRVAHVCGAPEAGLAAGVCVCVCVRACAHVCGRTRARERERGRAGYIDLTGV